MKSARDTLEEATEAVREIVRAHRMRCGTVKEALALAAADLHLSLGRTKDFWHREAATVQAHEADAIRRAKATHHAEEAARLAADLERHRRDRMRVKAALRPTLDLREPKQPNRQWRLAL